ncbi:MAG: PAS domain S-box protein [Elusimicrobia bacterium]|nr:PAS domain S-box protein [Elusimicrobiota bacterium]
MDDRALQDLIGRNEASLEDLLENIDDIVVLATLDGGRILYANRAWREKLGYDEADIARMNAHDILHPQHRAEVKANDAKLLAGETLRNVERTFVAKDGRLLHVDGCVSFRFKDGKPWYARAIFHDITERKRAEALRGELLDIANHEMRSPLMVILMSLELIERDAAALPEQARKMARTALSNSQRMLHLVNSYLDISKLESGGAPMKRKPLDLSALIERALESNRPLGARGGVTLEPGELASDARVDGDAERLMQVLTNLISNAVKFSKSGNAVVVSLSRRGDRWRVGVTDRGPGIPADFRPHVFGKFAQAEGHLKGGSGLGLAISKAIVERHGGAIGFDTSDGAGTTFHFDLPAL